MTRHVGVVVSIAFMTAVCGFFAAADASAQSLDLNADRRGDLFRYDARSGHWAMDLTPGTPGFVSASGRWSADPNPPSRVTLREAVAEALRRSPALRPAQDRAAVAEIQERVAASRFGVKVAPTFSTGTDAGATPQMFGVLVGKRFVTGTEVTLGADSTSYGAGADAMRTAGYSLSVRQPLLRGFGKSATAELTNARRARSGSERQIEDARRDLVVSVAAAYYSVLRQQRMADASERAVDRARTLRTASDARAKVGLSTQLDVLRADLLVSQSEAQLVAQREMLAASFDQLKLLLGRRLDTPLDIDVNDLPEPATSDPADVGRSTDGTIAGALASRPDVLEARDRIADAERTASIARWNLLPQVNVVASYTQHGLGSSSNQIFDRLFNGWRLGLTTSYSLDRTADAAAVDVAAVSTRAARQALNDLEQRVAADVRRAGQAMKRSQAAIGIQTKALDLAEKQLRLAQLRYERGLAGNFDVVDAENNLFQAQSALIAAQVDQALAALALDRAAGTLEPERFLR